MSRSGRRSRSTCLTALLSALLLALPVRAALVELEHFDRGLAAAGVGDEYSDDGLEALLALVREEVRALEARAEGAEGDEKKDLARTAEAVEQALDVLAAAAKSPELADRAAAFPALESLLYSVRAGQMESQRGITAGIAFGILGNLSHSVPWLPLAERDRPLGAAAAAEAANLVDPGSGRAYPRPADLADLSAEAVSRLDVRPDHPMWRDARSLARERDEHGSAWAALERRVEARISESEDAPYRLDRARRVLRFRGIVKSGSSS
jgi:hypothetical protein